MIHEMSNPTTIATIHFEKSRFLYSDSYFVLEFVFFLQQQLLKINTEQRKSQRILFLLIQSDGSFFFVPHQTRDITYVLFKREQLSSTIFVNSLNNKLILTLIENVLLLNLRSLCNLGLHIVSNACQEKNLKGLFRLNTQRNIQQHNTLVIYTGN